MSEELELARDDVAAFLVALMAIDSSTGLEGGLGFALKEFLKTEGFNLLVQPIPGGVKDRFNLLVTTGPFSAPGPKVLFNTHLDTVPPYLPPRVVGDKIYGRGANDAKGQIASQVFALMRIAETRPDLAEHVGLLLVVGEETDHIGMKSANKFVLKPDFLIVGEPTEMKFGSVQKGAVKVKFTAKGRAAHSGYPHLGESAIEKLLDVLADVRKHEWPSDPRLGATTLNIGLIEGGQALNALAAHASASVFVRVTHSAKEVLEVLQRLAKGRVAVEVLGINEPVLLSKPPKPYESHPVSFNTDIPYFDYRSHLKGAFLYGPGSITNAHSLDEFIPVGELKNSVDVLTDLVIGLLET